MKPKKTAFDRFVKKIGQDLAITALESTLDHLKETRDKARPRRKGAPHEPRGR